MTAKVWRMLAAIYAAVAVVAVILYFRWPWLPGVDFDIIGFFWAIRNAPNSSASRSSWPASPTMMRAW